MPGFFVGWIPALTTPPANKLAFGDPSVGTTKDKAGTTVVGGTATACTVMALLASAGTLKRKNHKTIKTYLCMCLPAGDALKDFFHF